MEETAEVCRGLLVEEEHSFNRLADQLAKTARCSRRTAKSRLIELNLLIDVGRGNELGIVSFRLGQSRVYCRTDSPRRKFYESNSPPSRKLVPLVFSDPSASKSDPQPIVWVRAYLAVDLFKRVRLSRGRWVRVIGGSKMVPSRVRWPSLVDSLVPASAPKSLLEESRLHASRAEARRSRYFSGAEAPARSS